MKAVVYVMNDTTLDISSYESDVDTSGQVILPNDLGVASEGLEYMVFWKSKDGLDYSLIYSRDSKWRDWCEKEIQVHKLGLITMRLNVIYKLPYEERDLVEVNKLKSEEKYIRRNFLYKKVS